MPAYDTEIVTSRLLHFSPSRVYDAFADPARLIRWWGPHGTTSTFHVFELRPGGHWELTMRGPWGEATMRKCFTAVEPGRRIAVRHEQEGHTFTLDMTLQPTTDGASTRVTWRTTFATAGQLAAVREVFAQANEENLDRLVAALAADV